MLRKRNPPPIKLRPVSLDSPLPPNSPRSQQPPDVQIAHTSTTSNSRSTHSHWKRLLQHYRVIKARFPDFYAAWMEQHTLHAERLENLVTAGLDIHHAVKEELRRYHQFYTVSMIPHPCKPLHVSHLVMPTWKPPLENAFMWLGDWRPSAIFGFLSACHDTHVIRLPPHHVGFLRELLRISHVNENILDVEFAASQSMSVPDDVSGDGDSLALPALLIALQDGGCSSGKRHVRAELVTCLGRNLAWMNRIVAKAQDLRFRAVETVVNLLLTETQAAHFFQLFARFQGMFHDVALSLIHKLR